MRLSVIGAVALLLAVLPGSVAAQVSCTTYFAHSSMPMTDCSTPAGSVNCVTYFADSNMPMTSCDGSAFTAPPPTYVAPAPVYVAPPPPPVYVPPVDPGFHFTLVKADGSQEAGYLPLGAFVKGEDALAIYVVADERLHAFARWEQFLRAGGKADLSNVQRFPHLPAEALGVPVPADW